MNPVDGWLLSDGRVAWGSSSGVCDLLFEPNPFSEKEAGRSENRRGRSPASLYLRLDPLVPERRESTETRLLSPDTGSRMLVGGYRLLARWRLAPLDCKLRPPKIDPVRPKSFSLIPETVFDRLWPLGTSCWGVMLNLGGSGCALGVPIDMAAAWLGSCGIGAEIMGRPVG